MQLVTQFTDPLYIVLLLTVVEFFKYLGVFEDLKNLEFISTEKEKTDAKRGFTMLIGAFLFCIFYVTEGLTEWRYAVKLLISFAVTVAGYDFILKGLIKKAKKLIKKG